MFSARRRKQHARRVRSRGPSAQPSLTSEDPARVELQTWEKRLGETRPSVMNDGRRSGVFLKEEDLNGFRLRRDDP